jgi:quinol monooxygenase YgiN
MASEPVRVIARAAAREGKGEELKAVLRRLIRPTRAEKGCRYYELFASNQPGRFYFHELWESKADLDAHAASSHFKELIGKAQELLSEPLEVNLLQEIE